MEFQHYDTDTWASQIDGKVLNIHPYIIDLKKSNRGENFYPFSLSGQVINMLYYPFLNMDDIHKGAIMQIDFDQEYYGTADINAKSPTQYLSPPPQVFKIYGKPSITPKSLGTFERYPMYLRDNIGKRHWANESKIFQYPYHFVTINDYINTPLVLKNEFIPTYPDVAVNVFQPLTMTGGYTIYVDGYKGDKDHKGVNEGMLANAGLDLPTSSSEYAQFMATSKAQFIAQNEAGNRNEWTNFGRGAVSVIGGAIQTGLGAMAIGSTGGSASFLGAGSMMGAGIYAMGQGFMDMIQAHVTQTNRIEQSQALVSDMMSAPRNVTMSSSDILLSSNRNENHVWVNRYMVNNHYRQKLADYWHLYGYKQNKFMEVNTTSRKYWNYIKTMGVNIESNSMDKSEIELLKTIYDNGIRFWHIGDGMHKYEVDNVEVQ